MGGISLIHMMLMTIIGLIPIVAAIAVFVFLARIARDVHQIRKSLQGRDETP